MHNKCTFVHPKTPDFSETVLHMLKMLNKSVYFFTSEAFNGPLLHQKNQNMLQFSPKFALT